MWIVCFKYLGTKNYLKPLCNFQWDERNAQRLLPESEQCLVSSWSLGVPSVDSYSLGNASSNVLKLLLTCGSSMHWTAGFNPNAKRFLFWTITGWELVAIYTMAYKVQANETAFLNPEHYFRYVTWRHVKWICLMANDPLIDFLWNFLVPFFFFNALWSTFPWCFAESHYQCSSKRV